MQLKARWALYSQEYNRCAQFTTFLTQIFIARVAFSLCSMRLSHMEGDGFLDPTQIVASFEWAGSVKSQLFKLSVDFPLS